MKTHLLLIIAAGCIFSLQGGQEMCPYADSLWNQVNNAVHTRLLQEPSTAAMSSECFAALLQRINESRKNISPTSVVELLARYCKENRRFELGTLHAVLALIRPDEYKKVAKDIVTLWETWNGKFQRKCTELEEKGQFLAADSLCQGFHKLGMLDGYELLTWIRIKTVINDFDGAAELFCLISRLQSNLYSIAQNQFIRFLTEMDSQQVRRSILAKYTECMRADLAVDPRELSLWLSDVCERFELFSEQVDIVIEFDTNDNSKWFRLLQIARKRFENRLFRESIRPAYLAVQHIPVDSLRHIGAAILYQSYYQIEKKDSALIWLEKSMLTQQSDMVRAVTLYQTVNAFEKADSLIEQLPRSISKDTLYVRQLLFTNQLKKAEAHLATITESTYWKYFINDAYLWKIRAAVFGGKLFYTGSYLDTLGPSSINPSWKYAPEILSTTLALQRLEARPDAFTFWGALKYAAYTAELMPVVNRFNPDQWPEEILLFLTKTILESLIAHNMPESAQNIIDKIPNLHTDSAIRYYHAEICFMRGLTDKAKELFEQLILENSDPVYLQKARIFLMKLPKSENM